MTNIPASGLSAHEVIVSYHDPWHLEQSFRMSKTDLEACPVFHHSEPSTHLTIVIAALAITRYQHDRFRCLS